MKGNDRTLKMEVQALIIIPRRIFWVLEMRSFEILSKYAALD